MSGFGNNRTIGIMLNEREEQQKLLDAAKAGVASVNQDIAILAKPLVDAALKRADKVSGTVNIAQGDEIFKGAVDKTVKWDSAMLFALAATMPWEKAKDIFKFELSVGEKVYAAVTDADLKPKLTAARTVTYSEPKITRS